MSEVSPHRFFSSRQLLEVWPFLSATPILTQFAWSPLVLSAAQHNFAIFPDPVGTTHCLPHSLSSPWATNQSLSSSTLTLGGVYSDLLALHVRRGDFKRHCPRLAKRSYQFHGFNSFEGLPDPWIPFNGSSSVRTFLFFRI